MNETLTLLKDAIEWLSLAQQRIAQNEFCLAAFALGCCEARIHQLAEFLELKASGHKSWERS